MVDYFVKEPEFFNIGSRQPWQKTGREGSTYSIKAVLKSIFIAVGTQVANKLYRTEWAQK